MTVFLPGHLLGLLCMFSKGALGFEEQKLCSNCCGTVIITLCCPWQRKGELVMQKEYSLENLNLTPKG